MIYLTRGFVTQNETWISYKTRSGTKSLTTLQDLAEDLEILLKEKNISYYGDFHIEYSENSVTRKGNVTVMVKSNCPNKELIPYAANAID